MDFGTTKDFSSKNNKRASAELQEGFKNYNKLEFVILIANRKVWRINKTTVLATSSKNFKVEFEKFITL